MPLTIRAWPKRPRFYAIYSGVQAVGEVERWTEHQMPDMFRWRLDACRAQGVSQGRDEMLRAIRAAWEHWLSHARLVDAPPPDAEADDAEVDAVIAEFDGDPRAAIKALLDDLGALARDADRLISRGYVRGRKIARR